MLTSTFGGPCDERQGRVRLPGMLRAGHGSRVKQRRTHRNLLPLSPVLLDKGQQVIWNHRRDKRLWDSRYLLFQQRLEERVKRDGASEDEIKAALEQRHESSQHPHYPGASKLAFSTPRQRGASRICRSTLAVLLCRSEAERRL